MLNHSFSVVRNKLDKWKNSLMTVFITNSTDNSKTLRNPWDEGG